MTKQSDHERAVCEAVAKAAGHGPESPYHPSNPAFIKATIERGKKRNRDKDKPDDHAPDNVRDADRA